MKNISTTWISLIVSVLFIIAAAAPIVAFAEEARLSASLREICSTAEALGVKECRKVDDLAAYLHGIENAEPADDLPVIIAGSLYLAGEVLEILETPEYVLDL